MGCNYYLFLYYYLFSIYYIFAIYNNTYLFHFTVLINIYYLLFLLLIIISLIYHIIIASEDLKLRIWDSNCPDFATASFPAKSFPRKLNKNKNSTLNDPSLTDPSLILPPPFFHLSTCVASCGRLIITGSNGFEGEGSEIIVWDRIAGAVAVSEQVKINN